MENKISKITTKQLVFLANGSTVGMVWIYLPRSLCAQAHQNAWLAVLISALYPIVSWILIDRALRHYPEYNFVNLSWHLFGKVLGSILLAVVILYYILVAGLIMASVARLVQVYALPQTPLKVIIAVLFFCTIFVAIKGIQVTAWFDEISLYLILLLMLVYCLPLQIGDYTNLLPVGDIPLKDMGRATLQAVWAQSGIEVLLIFYSLANHPQSVLKAGFISIGLSTLIYGWVTFVCVLVLGADITMDFMWPGLTILKVSLISVFERLEFFYLAMMLFIVTRTIISSHAAGAYALTGLFPKGQQYYPYMVLLMGLGALITAIIPHNIVEVGTYTTYLSYLALVLGIAYPLLYWFIGKFRGKKEWSDA